MSGVSPHAVHHLTRIPILPPSVALAVKAFPNRPRRCSRLQSRSPRSGCARLLYPLRGRLGRSAEGAEPEARTQARCAAGPPNQLRRKSGIVSTVEPPKPTELKDVEQAIRDVRTSK